MQEATTPPRPQSCAFTQVSGEYLAVFVNFERKLVTLDTRREVYTLPLELVKERGTWERWGQQCYLTAVGLNTGLYLGPLGLRLAQAFRNSLQNGTVTLTLPALAQPEQPEPDPDPIAQPAPVVEAEQPEQAPASQNLTLTPPAPAATLTRQRAKEMHKRVAALGLGNEERYALAARIAGRPIESLTALTEGEARCMWNEARRLSAARRSA